LGARCSAIYICLLREQFSEFFGSEQATCQVLLGALKARKETPQVLEGAQKGRSKSFAEVEHRLVRSFPHFARDKHSKAVFRHRYIGVEKKDNFPLLGQNSM